MKPQSFRAEEDSLCDVEMAAGRCCVQGRPALIVLLVHVGSVLHQELHHVKIFIDTSLQREVHSFTY